MKLTGTFLALLLLVAMACAEDYEFEVEKDAVGAEPESRFLCSGRCIGYPNVPGRWRLGFCKPYEYEDYRRLLCVCCIIGDYYYYYY